MRSALGRQWQGLWVLLSVLLTKSSSDSVTGFVSAFVAPPSPRVVVSHCTSSTGLSMKKQEEEDNHSAVRRNLLASAVSLLPLVTTRANAADPGFASNQASTSSDASGVYKAAKRPTAYRVDSTQPPTLLPIASARDQTTVLKRLAAGGGTDKDAIVVDTLNLNNLLNKAVFGTADFVQSKLKADDSKTGLGYASYVCLGLPQETAPQDVGLANSLLSTLRQARNNANDNMAVGLHWAPYSSQSALDQYVQARDYPQLTQAMTQAGVDASTLALYQPLLENLPGIDLIALSPETADLQTAITQGLQQVDPDRRSQYVLDAQGFIGLTQQPQFKLYTDRSLFKDLPKGIKEGDFFSQRILAHEAAATACAKYAQQHQAANGATPLIALLAPIPDVRYLVGGINGRLPRISNYLGLNKVTPNAVTTILCNPTAANTLSKTRYLRLEIGTGPETIDLQAKVADYLWFSQSPKVNMIPRLMEGKGV